MDDHPSANTSRVFRTTPQTDDIGSDWQVAWLALSDVMGRFHVARLRSLLDDALANRSDADECGVAKAHAALTDFFDAATVLVARRRRVHNDEIAATFADDTHRSSPPDSAIQMLVCVWPDPFEFVACEVTPDRRARCFLSEPSGRLMSRTVRLMESPQPPPKAGNRLADNATSRAVTQSWHLFETLDVLVTSMCWPDDAVAEGQLSTLSLTRRSNRLSGISVLLQQLENDDLAHGQLTGYPANVSPQDEAEARDIDEFDLSECMVTADGKYVPRPRHISASTRFRQSVESVEYGLDRYVAKLLRDRFPCGVRRAATVHGQFHLNIAQWMVSAPDSAAYAFRANAMAAERGWLTGVARQTILGEGLPAWILPVLYVVDVRGSVRAAFGSALVTEIRRLRKPLTPPVCVLRPAMMRYLASAACNTLSVDLIPPLCLTLAPHAPDLWPMNQSRVHGLAEAEHIRLQWQTALLLHTERTSATEATLRSLRQNLLMAGAEETKKRLRGMSTMTMGDWVDRVRNPIAHVWQAQSSMAEGSETPWEALFIRWLDAVATLVPEAAQRSERESRILALSTSTVRTLRSALTSLSDRTELSGLLVADLSNDSMPNEMRQLLHVLARRYRSIDGFDDSDGATGFVFPRFIEPLAFEIAVDGVAYRAELLTELNRIREVGDLMQNCLRRLHSVFHMLTRGDVLIAWFAASAPDLPIGVVELAPIAEPHGLPLVAPSFSAAQWPLRWSVSEALGPKNSPLSDEQKVVYVAIAKRFQMFAKTAVKSASTAPTQHDGSATAHRWGVLFDTIARAIEASDVLEHMLLGANVEEDQLYSEAANATQDRGEGVLPIAVIDAELLAAMQRFRLRRSFEIATSEL